MSQGAAYSARMESQELIGWASSFILVATIYRQIYKQWRDDTSRGVSFWLFAGQIASSIGFVVYSALVGNWVFVFTNGALFLGNIVGLAIVLRHRRRDRRQQRGAGTRPAPTESAR